MRDATGPARLPDMVEGRSKQAFSTWLSEREQHWRDRVEVVAMDGFTGYQDRHERGAARHHCGDGPPSTWSTWLPTPSMGADGAPDKTSSAATAAPAPLYRAFSSLTHQKAQFEIHSVL